MPVGEQNRSQIDPGLKAVSANLLHLHDIVAIHLLAFKGFFLESLGSHFLKELYRGFISDSSGVCLVVIDGTRVVGFVAGTTQPEEFYQRLLRRRWYAFLLAGATSMALHPIRVGKKFLTALHYRGEKPTDVPNAALLSSIGVAPSGMGKGIGRILVQAFCERAKTSGARSVFLTTDRDKNDAVNEFYRSNGFDLHGTFLKERSRWMNLYVRLLFDAQPANQDSSCVQLLITAKQMSYPIWLKMPHFRPPSKGPTGTLLLQLSIKTDTIAKRLLKRGFDIVASGVALAVLFPLLLILAILVRFDSAGPSLFPQTRSGKSFRPFRLLKFRSMAHGKPGSEITYGQDDRITKFGAILRRFKLDELPQLWNVFCGDMSIVGPRPELPSYVERFREDYQEILSVRPGITDPASILHRSEAEILGSTADPISHYTEVILPEKIEISKQYVRTANFGKDICVIFQTIAALIKK